MNKSEAIERVDKIVDDMIETLKAAKQKAGEEIDKLQKDCDEHLTEVEQLQVIGYLVAETARRRPEVDAS